MSDDPHLLQQFVEENSEAAFTTLVHRHIGLVHATALRRLGGDAALADDATQIVFVSLARKARGLRGHATLAGWLYLATHHATAEIVRREQRRKQREFTAHSMQLADANPDVTADAVRLRPLLDDALITLPPTDREAIVLRFFAQHSFAEIGAALQLSEEAARKRVDRSLAKLRDTLVQRGLTSTVAALGSALTAVGAVTTPAGLSAQVAAIALAQSMVASGIMTALQAWLWPTLTAGTLLAAATLTILPQRETNSALGATLARNETKPPLAELRAENARLKRDLVYAQQPVATPTAAANPSVSQPAAAPKAPASARPSKGVQVDTHGALSWDGEPVTLDEYLSLVRHQRLTAPGGESAVIVKADDVRFLQLLWVMQETSSAGIDHLMIESNAVPDHTFTDGPFTATWF